MAFICIDVDTHKRVTVLGDRLSDTIKKFFEENYSRDERAKVKHICMDMNAVYQNFVHELFPNAEIVIDRFHIIQLLGRAMDQMRVQALRQIKDKHSQVYKALKPNWKIYHKADPDAKTKHYRFGINESLTDQELIDIGITPFLNLHNAYETYIDIHDALLNSQTERLSNLIKTYSASQFGLATRPEQSWSWIPRKAWFKTPIQGTQCAVNGSIISPSFGAILTEIGLTSRHFRIDNWIGVDLEAVSLTIDGIRIGPSCRAVHGQEVV
ncbi:ISL3 family transposase [Lactiplantibacillus plantarum]|nr:ISL3 family transposase [Lactiplantibacillus plantarum]